jgi:circadian clock protein KaiC
MPTGVPNLNPILGGGIPRGALAIVMGPPGSGKTTLANQMAFAAARRGERTLVLTALSEPTNKLIAHLRAYSFFDPDLIGDAIQFLSLQQFLSGSLPTISEEILALVRQEHAVFVVLDGFRGIRGADIDPQRAREFLYDVGTSLSLWGATTLITSEANPRDPNFFPEMTTADVIIGLHYALVGVQQRRGLEIVKMRGAEMRPGLHDIALGTDGIVIYPQLETSIATVARPAVTAAGIPSEALVEPIPRQTVPGTTVDEPRLTFALPELDALMGGGLTSGTSTVLIGSLGSGKTLLGLHFALAGVRSGDPALFLSFRETIPQLLQKADAFVLGAQMREALAPGAGLALLRWEPVQVHPDLVAHQLLTAIDHLGIKRLVVDSIAELERAVADHMIGITPARVPDYLAALLAALRQRHVTALFIRESPGTTRPPFDFSAESSAILAENVLTAQQVTVKGRLHRFIAIPKMRFSVHAHSVREYVIIAPEGIRILPREATGEDILTTIADQYNLVIGGSAELSVQGDAGSAG